VAGRWLLAYGEQGVGDEIMFASCLPELIASAGKVVIVCDPRLKTLFARSFPQTTAESEPEGELELPLRRTPPSWLLTERFPLSTTRAGEETSPAPIHMPQPARVT
jgi:hypothetical protein